MVAFIKIWWVLAVVVLGGSLYIGWVVTQCGSPEIESRIDGRDSIIKVLRLRVDSLSAVKSVVNSQIQLQETKTQKISTTREIVVQGLRYIQADSLVQVFKLQLDSAGMLP